MTFFNYTTLFSSTSHSLIVLMSSSKMSGKLQQITAKLWTKLSP